MQSPAPALSVAATSVPAMSRRHAAGTESARGLLFTVLGEFVLPGGGLAWTSAVISVLSRLGVEEKASRQALMRTAADGWLTSERVGRRTRWQLTGEAERLLAEGTERIYGFTGSAPEWDGRWLLVLARAPETDRPARHLLRTRLGRAGFGSPAPGVWISSHAGRAAEARRVLEEAGVLEGAQIFTAEYQGGGDLASMISRAWDLDAIEQSYREFIGEFAGAATIDPLAQVIDLVHAWRRFPWIDPGLPGALLPARWSGAQAAGLFARLHASWAADATAEWARLNERG
jgi:phenylacetic acid degradation operon negative regulatory protein